MNSQSYATKESTAREYKGEGVITVPDSVLEWYNEKIGSLCETQKVRTVFDSQMIE